MSPFASTCLAFSFRWTACCRCMSDRCAFRMETVHGGGCDGACFGHQEAIAFHPTVVSCYCVSSRAGCASANMGCGRALHVYRNDEGCDVEPCYTWRCHLQLLQCCHLQLMYCCYFLWCLNRDQSGSTPLRRQASPLLCITDDGSWQLGLSGGPASGKRNSTVCNSMQVAWYSTYKLHRCRVVHCSRCQSTPDNVLDYRNHTTPGVTLTNDPLVSDADLTTGICCVGSSKRQPRQLG